MKWYHFSDCACAWSGPRFDRGNSDESKTKIFWAALLSMPKKIPARLNPASRTEQEGLIQLMEAVMNNYHDNLAFPWEGWDSSLPVNVCVWPKGQEPEYEGETISAVLCLDSFYLVLHSQQMTPGSTQIDIDYSKNSAKATITSREYGYEAVADVKILEPNPGDQIWLDLYMDVVDNNIIGDDGSNGAIRDKLRKNMPTDDDARSDFISEEISGHVDANAASRRDFDKMHERITYDVHKTGNNQFDVNAGIQDSTFSSNGEDLSLTLGLKLPDRPGPSTLSPDYPCGNRKNGPGHYA